MSETRLIHAGRAAKMRRHFDDSFAEARPPDPPASEDFLVVRCGGEPYAIRLGEIAGLYAGQKVTPLPGRTPGLVGIAGFRGAIAPVWDLALSLGLAAAAEPRWLALAAAAPVAFAFAELDGHLRLARDRIGPHRNGAAIGEIAHRDAGACPIVDLAALIAQGH